MCCTSGDIWSEGDNNVLSTLLDERGRPKCSDGYTYSTVRPHAADEPQENLRVTYRRTHEQDHRRRCDTAEHSNEYVRGFGVQLFDVRRDVRIHRVPELEADVHNSVGAAGCGVYVVVCVEEAPEGWA